jgi:asparagine synthase (glutamine-hydrolysing)
MCGIAGLLLTRQDLAPERVIEQVQALCASMTHRGPDAGGVWSSSDQRCTLGHRRLAIIDLDPRSNQPMLTPDGHYAIVFNGEIYNYKELRRELEARGTRFRTESDTEVLLEGYVHWGDALFERLDGMFALAIYDASRRQLLLARDRLGEKPLYYARCSGALVFASELKALLGVDGLSITVSERGLFDYFALRYVPDPATIFDEIFSVQPGTWLRFDENARSQERAYYAFDVEAPFEGDEDDYVDAVDAALSAAVRTRLVADVPVGALLSSGIDSSLVCAVAARLTNRSVHCFGAGFVGDAENETPQAHAIADHLGLSFEALSISSGDLVHSAQRFGALLDEPNGDRSCVPTYLLSQLIRSHVTVAVSGDGGDELFAGYGRYLALDRDAGFRALPPAGQPERYFFGALPVWHRDVLEAAMPEQMQAFRRRFLSRFLPLFARTDVDTFGRLRTTDVYSYLPGAVLAKVDRMSMKHSLEVRTPFFSPQILALSSRLPRALVHGNGQLKLALRRVLERYLPDELLKAKKQGFGMPGAFFEQNASLFLGMAAHADECLRQWSPLAGRPSAFNALREGARANINSLWAWIVLGQWVESLPARTTRPAASLAPVVHA